jgi:pimeloyl-ACP methyl ester carboxylesterase
LLDGLELGQVALGGHSFGGLLSLYMAAHYPERISKLVVMDAAGSLHPGVRELIQPSIDRLGKVFPSWDAYIGAMRRMPFYDGWWDPTIESYYRLDVEIRDDGSVKPRSRPEAIIEAVDRALEEDWSQHLASVRQPLLLLNALSPFGPPGSPPLLPREQALETVRAVTDGRYLEIPGNHMTMLFGEGAKRMVEEITAFVRECPSCPNPED